jgi:hypothetical protein
VGDGEIDGLIIAQLEMQAGVILDAAPVAAVKRLAPDEVQRARHRLPVAFGQHQKHVVAQRLLRDVEEGPREIGRAPFPRAGVLVEHPEGIPMLGRISSPV